jgi:hypothetical protein
LQKQFQPRFCLNLKLAASFQVAADFAIKFLAVAIAFGDWVSNNMGTVKTLAAIIAGMFVVNGIATFITSLAAITTALVALRTLATTTGVALAFATGGTSAIAGAVGAAAVVAAVGVSYAANQYGSSLRQAPETKRPTMGGYPSSALGGSFPVTPAPVISGPNSDLQKFLASLGKTMTTTAKASKVLLTEEQKRLNIKLKELGIVTTEQQDAITQMAILKNAQRQKAIANSATIGAGSSGALGSKQGGNVSVYVAGSVSTENDLITAISDGLQRTTRRSIGGFGARFAPVAK